MKQFDARAYSIADFLEWQRHGLLDLSPKFQRRSVWTRAAKSFLVDTILRGKPMPKVLITQSLADIPDDSGQITRKNVRTVVDGQQRIRTILDYFAGSFTVLPSHNSEFAGKVFEQLNNDAQTRFLQYEIGVDLLFDVTLEEMLDIFARLNTYSVTLNKQERINARYLGIFKTTVYELGHAYAKFFLDSLIISEKQLSRMGEAELASDLFVSLIDSVQTNKNIERFYKKYESVETVPTEIVESRELFEGSMARIGLIYDTIDLALSNWSRQPWFYTLFVCVAHSLRPLQGLPFDLRPNFSDKPATMWRAVLDEISAKFDEYTSKEAGDAPGDFKLFINFAQRRTADTEARRSRAKFVLSRIAAA